MMSKALTREKPEGLYRPQFEHDACGIGMYADIKGRASNEIVKTALEMLARLDHRAGKAADGKTGDGAGILVQVPDRFFQEVCGFDLPPAGHYGVGMFSCLKTAQAVWLRLEKLKRALLREI
ncbi:glutamate synthase [NADPH] large chain [Sporolactobacillus inulinus]|uniref:Glutamate synthase [NADPH] large chain n=1 Tax=Sporolactobacillus inulinus TaxID=2078 RepID=A0A4Y1ZDG9_9BACL|nr:glutamate synthase [NADPH] large chain [Sporolactobacillus inulinus]